MIGTRTPFRISFVGGGTDLQSFYRNYPGAVVSTTINKYMYIFIHPFFNQKTQVKYSKTELVENIEEIQHPILRECLKKYKISGVDINSIADIPSGTGMGSSSAFTVGLIHALSVYNDKFVSKEFLAKEASYMEIDVLREPIGKQDQYASAFGGLNFISFFENEEVHVEKIHLAKDKWIELQNSLCLFYLGETRAARDILQDQKNNMEKDNSKIQILRNMTEIAVSMKNNLNSGNIDNFGELLHENWLLKKQLSSKISDEKINHYYQIAIENGASGGKLLGAGQSGFLLFYCRPEKQEKLKVALSELRQIPFEFDSYGTKVIFYNEY